MRYHFWYVLIQIALGLIGWQYLTFTNLGGIYAFGLSGVVQAYAVYEIHKAAKPQFDAMQATVESLNERKKNLEDYRNRLTKIWFTRSCMYALLTLIAAMGTRGATAV
jgi:hypothetical protein